MVGFISHSSLLCFHGCLTFFNISFLLWNLLSAPVQNSSCTRFSGCVFEGSGCRNGKVYGWFDCARTVYSYGRRHHKYNGLLSAQRRPLSLKGMNGSLCILIKPKIWLILKRRREPPLLRVTDKSANRGRTSWRSFAKLSRKSYSSRNQWSGRFYSKVTTARSLVTFPARKCGFHSWDAGFSTVRDQTKGFPADQWEQGKPLEGRSGPLFVQQHQTDHRCLPRSQRDRGVFGRETASFWDCA